MRKFLKDATIVSILVLMFFSLIPLSIILRSLKENYTEIVKIKLGDGFLTVPRGYLEGVLRGGDSSFISLRVMLPNLDPQTEQNKSHFDGYKPEIVTIYVYYDKDGIGTGEDIVRNLQSSKSLSEYPIDDPTPVSNIDGYKTMRFWVVSRTDYISKENKIPFMISCDDEEHQRPDLRVPNPHCEVNVPIKGFEKYRGPSGGVKYHIIIMINRVNLQQVPEITQKAIDLISQNFQVIEK